MEPTPVLTKASHRSPRRPSLARQPRILCYGDSNTAGFCDKGNRFKPYSEALAETLAAAGTCCEVRSCGLSGITTRDLVDGIAAAVLQDVAGRTGRGLARILDDDGPYDFAVILSGTNDLALGVSPHTIQSDLAQMHAACHERGTATIALIPPTNVGEWVRPVRQQLAQLHAIWARGMPNVVACLDAEELVPRKQGFWEKDEIHLSPSGSMELGRCLAPRILPHLKRLSGAQESRQDDQEEVHQLLKPAIIRTQTLEKPSLPDACANGTSTNNKIYTAGTEVEVWSNSRKAWCRGHVEKVEDGQAHLCFTLPCGSTARKELPLNHKDLRRYMPIKPSLPPTNGSAKVSGHQVLSSGMQASRNIQSASAPAASLVHVASQPRSPSLTPPVQRSPSLTPPGGQSQRSPSLTPTAGGVQRSPSLTPVAGRSSSRTPPAADDAADNRYSTYGSYQFRQKCGGEMTSIYDASPKGYALGSARWGMCRV